MPQTVLKPFRAKLSIKNESEICKISECNLKFIVSCDNRFKSVDFAKNFLGLGMTNEQPLKCNKDYGHNSSEQY